MLKHFATLEVKIGEKTYELRLPSEAHLGEIHDALFQMRSYIIGRIQEVQKQDAPKESEPPIEE